MVGGGLGGAAAADSVFEGDHLLRKYIPMVHTQIRSAFSVQGTLSLKSTHNHEG